MYVPDSILVSPGWYVEGSHDSYHNISTRHMDILQPETETQLSSESEPIPFLHPLLSSSFSSPLLLFSSLPPSFSSSLPPYLWLGFSLSSPLWLKWSSWREQLNHCVLKSTGARETKYRRQWEIVEDEEEDGKKQRRNLRRKREREGRGEERGRGGREEVQKRGVVPFYLMFGMKSECTTSES